MCGALAVLVVPLVPVLAGVVAAAVVVPAPAEPLPPVALPVVVPA